MKFKFKGIKLVSVIVLPCENTNIEESFMLENGNSNPKVGCNTFRRRYGLFFPPQKPSHIRATTEFGTKNILESKVTKFREISLQLNKIYFCYHDNAFFTASTPLLFCTSTL